MTVLAYLWIYERGGEWGLRHSAICRACGVLAVRAEGFLQALDRKLLFTRSLFSVLLGWDRSLKQNLITYICQILYVYVLV